VCLYVMCANDMHEYLSRMGLNLLDTVEHDYERHELVSHDKLFSPNIFFVHLLGNSIPPKRNAVLGIDPASLRPSASTICCPAILSRSVTLNLMTSRSSLW